MSETTILVTGGAGFIGSCFVHQHVANTCDRIVTIDKLTYAGNVVSLPPTSDHHLFVEGDIGDAALVRQLLKEHQPQCIVNFAAESHVDRSIDGPAAFVQTNVVGTCTLLDATLEYLRALPDSAQAAFRFLHVSTDEVYGSLGPTGRFLETTPYAPNSPYSASKAASDMFVRSYHKTYGLPALITNCSNNYGPRQFPEKLVPLMILNALERKPLPIYGDGGNVRDWLYVEDHCAAIDVVLKAGRIGETYNVGGDCERTNLEIVSRICELTDQLAETDASADLITFVEDRPGHDRRYAVDTTKIASELGWRPSVTFEEGLSRTIQWYLDNMDWVSAVSDGEYGRERLGLEQ